MHWCKEGHSVLGRLNSLGREDRQMKAIEREEKMEKNRESMVNVERARARAKRGSSEQILLL